MVQEQLHEFAVGAAVEMAQVLMQDEVTRLCGERYAHQEGREAGRHGRQRGAITINGQRYPVLRPRARRLNGKEVQLPSYELLNAPSAMSEAACRRMVRGVSTRNYAEVIDAFAEGYGTSRSNVSREFIKGAEGALKRLTDRRFDGVRFAAILIDGVEYEDTTIIAAVGVKSDGKKQLLGLREGGTENAEVVKSLLADLRERGVACARPTLFVLDGSKALAKGVRSVFGEYALIQRCRLHKKRNIKAHLPERYWSDLEKRLAAAWNEANSYEEALKLLKSTAKWLEGICPDAAGSLREGMEETITLNTLGVKGVLLLSLASTNIIESTFSVARTVSHRVKRWRTGSMRLRWCAAGLLFAESKFQRVRGFSAIPALLLALDSLCKKRKLEVLKKAA